MTIEVVYDDREPVPVAIGTIARDISFGGIVHRRQRLREVIAEAAARANLSLRLVASSDDQQRLAHDLANRPANHFVARIPSSLMPVNPERFADLLQRLPYALNATVFGLAGDEAVTLLRRDDALALLGAPDPQARRQVLLALRDSAIDMTEACAFYDLRDVSDFLAFMASATEVRHFNHLVSDRGVFRKSSRDKDKMRGEHDFFHVVPPAMKRFLIPTFDYREEGETASYAMEAMRIPDGAMQIIHNSFDPTAVETLLDCFFAFIDARHREPAAPQAVLAAGEREMITKLDRRMAEFLAMGAGRRVDRLLADGGVNGGLTGLHERARTLIRAELGADSSDHLALSHGDPCLSNILFNPGLGLFRLIDPRGATRLEDGLMHPVYDLAKLSHSLIGGYDFINNGLFECKLGADLDLTLELDGGGPSAFVRQAFLQRLASGGWNPRLTRACEMSLFLSMLPLHADAPRKLPAFALAAHAILNELDAR